MNQIVQSKELVKLLGEEHAEYPEDVIPYKWSFPHEFVPDTITETDKFINFDMRADIDKKNNTYRDITIYFFVVCHQKVVRYSENGKEYLWYDKVTCELDNIFSEKNILGVGETILVENRPYSPENNFKGRLLIFKVKDFSNGLKYGK